MATSSAAVSSFFHEPTKSDGENTRIKNAFLNKIVVIGGAAVQLNGKARSADGSPIVCRHLAYAVLTEDLNKAFLANLMTIKGIESIAILRDNIFDNKAEPQNGSHYYFSYFHHIGETLFNLCGDIKTGDGRSFLMSSITHIMCIKLKNKNGLFSVYYYDPNCTNGYKKIYGLTRDNLKSLRSVDFMSRECLTAYDMISSPIALITYTGSVKKAFHDIDSRLTLCDAIYVSLEYGFSTAVANYLAKVLSSALTNVEKVELLAAKRADGVPGLSIALQLEHAETVATYIEQVLASTLTNTEKFNLLAAKRADGVPGLFMALRLGHAETVATYVAQILASALTNVEKVELLVAKAVNGVPGLFVALQNSASTTADIYFDKIVSSPLLVDILIAYRHWPASWRYLKDKIFSYVTASDLNDAERRERSDRLKPAIDLHRDPGISELTRFMWFLPAIETQTRRKLNAYPEHSGPSPTSPTESSPRLSVN